MTRANGLFEAYVNERAFRIGPKEHALMAAVSEVVRGLIPKSQVRWAGSLSKGTAIVDSDLDLCVESTSPVTEAQRRALRAGLEAALARPARVLSHAVRLPRDGASPKVDLAFANAAFGSRALPDVAAFHDRRARQAAVRGLKLWSRGPNLPHLPGWALEAVVVHLDASPEDRAPLELFLRVLEWLETRSSPAAVEAILRPAACPRWPPRWSAGLPGRLEALRNQARALRRRPPQPEAWTSTQDVERKLTGGSPRPGG